MLNLVFQANPGRTACLFRCRSCLFINASQQIQKDPRTKNCTQTPGAFCPALFGWVGEINKKHMDFFSNFIVWYIFLMEKCVGSWNWTSFLFLCNKIWICLYIYIDGCLQLNISISIRQPVLNGSGGFTKRLYCNIQVFRERATAVIFVGVDFEFDQPWSENTRRAAHCHQSTTKTYKTNHGAYIHKLLKTIIHSVEPSHKLWIWTQSL